MKQILKSKYFSVLHDSEKEMFYYVFNEKTYNMTDEEYKKEILDFADLVKKHKPLRVLGNMVDFGFSITSEIQEWVSDTLFSIYEEIGFQKIAILLSKEYVESLSIQQTMDEANAPSFQTAYFDNEDEANDWLLAA